MRINKTRQKGSTVQWNPSGILGDSDIPLLYLHDSFSFNKNSRVFQDPAVADKHGTIKKSNGHI
jgi:hypothetical protein